MIVAPPAAPVKRLTTTQRRPTHPELAVEHDRFLEMLPELMKTIPGKYIAMKDGEIVAVADDEVGALTAAYRLRPGVLFLARLVTDQPIPIEWLKGFRELPRLPAPPVAISTLTGAEMIADTPHVRGQQ